MEKRHYKATFILNLRETKRTVDALTTWLKELITTVGGTVEKVDDIGVRDFVRVTHKNNPNGHYISFFFTASGDVNTALQAKLRLETEVKRCFVEALEQKTAKA